MGKKTEELINLENQLSGGVVPNTPAILERGSGSRLWDLEGREYIDCNSGHGVANVGHAIPVVAQAVAHQAAELITAPVDFYHQGRAELLSRLTAAAPASLEYAFLCNSGTEAVEGALKFARAATGRTNFVAARRSFHGRSMGSLSATWNKNYREPFTPLVPGFSFAAYNQLEDWEDKVTQDTAGVSLEVVQGEGGVHPGMWISCWVCRNSAGRMVPS